MHRDQFPIIIFVTVVASSLILLSIVFFKATNTEPYRPAVKTPQDLYLECLRNTPIALALTDKQIDTCYLLSTTK